jgi:glycosyltransferase involved in cell wall biosynthesis
VRKKIVCTVTNDLVFDQRMNRICTSLSSAGYDVILVGRLKSNSKPLVEKSFKQKRLFCFFQKGKFFYIEYNIRLFFYLMFLKIDCICAIDLDSILPCLYVSKIRKTKRVYDAHELFCEMEEIVSRPLIYKLWKRIEKLAVPQFANGYTIGECYSNEFWKMYNVHYEIVRNATVLKENKFPTCPIEKYILYQGAVNEGRSFETLLPAIKILNCKLIICGEGNFFTQAQQLVKDLKIEHLVDFKGYIKPDKLIEYTQNAHIGITLFTNEGLSNYYSLANRFFDYMHANVPQVCTNYPEYNLINQSFEIAVLCNNTTVDEIVQSIQKLWSDDSFHNELKQNCKLAKEKYNWQQEEIKLVHFYKQLFEQ